MKSPKLRLALIGAFLAVTALISVDRARAFGRSVPASHLDIRLARSQPANNETLTVAPKSIVLWFNEAPVLTRTSVTLTGPDHRKVAVGIPRMGDNADSTKGAVVVPLADITSTGLFIVDWKAGEPGGNGTVGRLGFHIVAHGTPIPQHADTALRR